MNNVLITGCSTGIGYETALAFARAGYSVFAGMRKPETSVELKETAVKEKLPIDVLTMDVDNDESVSSAVNYVLKKQDKIDILINNAGILVRGAVEDVPVSAFHQSMETNFFGALRCIKSVLPIMRERKRGCIVNVSSLAGRTANALLAPYSASKYALESLSEALAQEVKGFGIRVIVIEPGIVQTPILTKGAISNKNSVYTLDKRINALAAEALKRPTLPKYIAEGILTILGDHSDRFRYPLGPDSESFLKWRGSMSDEEWIDLWSVNDDSEWRDRIRKQLGIDIDIGG